MDASPRLVNLFRAVVARRWWVLAIYALVLVPSVYYALRVHHDNSLDRLIVKSDPDYLTSREFEQVFGSGEYVVIIAEADDPFAPDVLQRFDAMEQSLAAAPGLEVNSVLSVYRRAKAGFSATPEGAQAFRKFVTGTDLFRKQGLFGDHFLAVAVLMHVEKPDQRLAMLDAIDARLAPYEQSPAPFRALRKVGQPYVNRLLYRETSETGVRYFLLFGLFIVILNLSLYRSVRTLIAFLVSLGVSVALTVGYVGLTGGVFTIVSSLVPMTVLITCTATLVYIHSRFVEHPEDTDTDTHQVLALANKFTACTASVFATAVGFAALAVSKIRPIREMGIWVAVGLVFTWIVVFTLFPALQKILKTPTQLERKISGGWFIRLTGWLPAWTYRWRWPLVLASLAMCVAGGFALAGMHLETDALEYIEHDSRLYQDTKRLEKMIAGLAMTEVWLQSDKYGIVSDASTVKGLDHFQRALEQEPQVGAVIGLPTMLRTLRYLDGQGDTLPENEDELEKATANLETLLAREPALQRFVESKNLSQTHLVVVTQTTDWDGYQKLEQTIRARWAEAVKRDPSLAAFKLRTTGIAPLQAKISHHLIPTLVESFVLSVAIIYGAFLVVFRNGAARLMAMIPSLFAILVMFLVMRLVGMRLNAATILVASTVLGASENDQIHFFFHFLEARKNGSTEDGLRHALVIAGRAILFATLINAGGFLAFALATLPPIREFGILSSLAFVLSMLADFTALIGALWIVFRAAPDRVIAARGAPVGNE